MKAGQDPGHAGSAGGPPSLFAADDLIPPGVARSRLDLEEGLVAARLHRGGQLLDELHGDVDPGLDRTGFDVIDRQQGDEVGRTVEGDAHATSPPRGRSGSTPPRLY